jgi:soluble P-type ATPase
MSFSIITNTGLLSYNELQHVLGVSRLNLWSCPCCGPSVLPSSVAPSPHYSWGVVLNCRLCNSSWLVCTECSNVRSYFRNAADCVAHHRRKHYVAIPRAAAAVNALIHSSGFVSSLESADLAVPALDSADNEVPALESADLAVPALESADDEVPALESADLAVPALESADLAVPALESADLAVPALESADLAVPALESADLAVPALESADLAVPALESADLAVPALKAQHQSKQLLNRVACEQEKGL